MFAGVRSRKLKARRKTKKLATASAPQNGTGNEGNLLHHGIADALGGARRLTRSCDSFATEIRPLALLTRPEGHGFKRLEGARRRLSLKEI